MVSPLERLLTAATDRPDRDLEPTYDFVRNLCYRTKGESNRPSWLQTCLERLYSSIERYGYWHVVRWSKFLEARMLLEHNVPRLVRVELVKIYYALTLTSGMDVQSAAVFSGMVCQLVRYVQHSESHASFLI